MENLGKPQRKRDGKGIGQLCRDLKEPEQKICVFLVATSVFFQFVFEKGIFCCKDPIFSFYNDKHASYRTYIYQYLILVATIVVGATSIAIS